MTKEQANYGSERGQIGRLKSGAVQAVISSPPYADTAVEKNSTGIQIEKQWQTYRSQGGGMSLEAFTAQQARHSDGQSSGQIAALKGGSVDACISSPPYAENPKAPPLPKHRVRGSSSPKEHGGPGPAYVSPNSQGQIGVLKGGSVEGVVSSPPYSEGLGHGGGAAQHKMYKEKGILSQATEKYGESDGQIDNLKTGDVEAVVSSPPFETSSHVNNTMFGLKPGKGIHSEVAGVRAKKDYIDPDSPGQIGQEKAESYWQAMDLVYRSCFQAIKPGGVIAIVVKDYCKAGKRVRLCDDTLKLLCHIGFTPLERIHAMLVSETVEAGLFGEERTKRQPKSFFRRLHEYLIQAQIHWVNVERKPLLLRRAKAELWSEYRDGVDNATEKEKSDPILWPPPKPTASKVLREAQFFAWREAGKPMRADERRIDHEEVLVCRKPQ